MCYLPFRQNNLCVCCKRTIWVSLSKNVDTRRYDSIAIVRRNNLSLRFFMFAFDCCFYPNSINNHCSALEEWWMNGEWGMAWSLGGYWRFGVSFWNVHMGVCSSRGFSNVLTTTTRVWHLEKLRVDFSSTWTAPCFGRLIAATTVCSCLSSYNYSMLVFR